MHSFEIASGKFKLEEQNGEWATELVHVPFLNNLTCRFIFDDGFIHDEDKYDYYHAINNILHINKDYLLEVSGYAFQYYRDITEQLNPHDGFIHIDSEQSIWKHVNFCPNLMVNRSEEDNQIYICLGGDCDWEPEHGLQLVFKNGQFLNRLSAIDFILINEDPTIIYQ